MSYGLCTYCHTPPGFACPQPLCRRQETPTVPNTQRPVDQWLLKQWTDLAVARAKGDIEKCVRLRRADRGVADHDGAEREERAWHRCNPIQETPIVPEAVNPKATRAAADDKLRLELVETALTHPLARVMAHGADKYGVRNWRTQPIEARTYVGAMRRHIDAWAEGEDTDPDSGQQHLVHLAACCMVVLDAAAHGTLTDNRDYAETKPGVESTHEGAFKRAFAETMGTLTAEYNAGQDDLVEELARHGKTAVDAVMPVLEPYRVDCGGGVLTCEMRASAPSHAEFVNYSVDLSYPYRECPLGGGCPVPGGCATPCGPLQ